MDTKPVRVKVNSKFSSEVYSWVDTVFDGIECKAIIVADRGEVAAVSIWDIKVELK